MNKELHPRQEEVLHCCMFLGKMVEGDLLDVKEKKEVKNEENSLGWYVKNNIELVAIRKSRTITHKKTVDPKEFKKTKEDKEKLNGLNKECMDNLPEICRTRIRTIHDQQQSIRTNYIKCHNDKTGELPFVGSVVQEIRQYIV